MRLVFPLLLVTVLARGAAPLPDAGPPPTAAATPPKCTRDAGLLLPDGFCAVLAGDHLGGVRNIAVGPNGDVFAAVEGGNGGVLALRDTDGDGVFDLQKRFGPGPGTGIALHGGYLYFGQETRVVRWAMASGDLEPRGAPETIVSDLPGGGHSWKPLVFLGGDTLIVDIGSRTNSCQREDRSNRSPGIDPCVELETRAGLWRFSGNRTGQTFKDGMRYATGLRNAEALAVQPGTGKLFASPHGRDQLGQNWGFSDEQNAELPAEEFMQVDAGDDFGWPYCYYDWQQNKLVLSPEYGGDGRTVGRCASKKDPLIGFPGHWGPMMIAFYQGDQFPATYRGGAFIAFHGSWNRAPLPQAGYRVVFIPFSDGRPTGQYATFATGADGPTDLRASGVAVGPDGSLYISSDGKGKIWRVMAVK
jgi:glucose/arabinose dehydrogenase